MTNLPSYADYGTYDESAHADLWDGVVGYWAPSLGPTGLRLHDVSRYGNWGTLTNMVPADDWVVQSGNSALNLTASDFVNCGDRSIWNFTGPFSAFVWGRWGSQGTDTAPIAKASVSNFYAGWILAFISAGNSPCAAFWNNGTRASGSTGVCDNTIRCVGISWTGTVAQVWVDGKLDGSGNTTTAPNAAGVDLFIGQYGFISNRTAQGQYFSAAVFNRALSANEWRRLYEIGPGGMLQRRSRRRVYVEPAGFRAYYASQRSRIIGGGLR